jgi:hypothetical protein
VASEALEINLDSGPKMRPNVALVALDAPNATLGRIAPSVNQPSSVTTEDRAAKWKVFPLSFFT